MKLVFYSWKLVLLSSVLCALGLAQQKPSGVEAAYKPDTPGGSTAEADLRVFGPSQDGWLYPVTRLNQSLPPWVQFGAQFRSRIEGQTGLDFEAVDDAYALTQLRLGAYLQPAEWLKVVGVTQDSRVFFNHHVPNKPSYQNIWDLREAYLQIGNSKEGWVDLTAGRQILSFGDERVIGPSDWTNMGRTFDAIRLDLHHTGLKLSAFASSVIFATDGAIDHHMQGNNLYGLYGSLYRFIPHTTLEPYVLWRLAPASVQLSENAGLGHLNEVTTGVRIAGTLPSQLDYDVEMNKQTGSLGPKSIGAWAGHWNVGYTFAKARTKPRPFLEYNYASGNRDPNSRHWGTHDQIYPSAHNKMDFADLFGWRNISDIRLGASEQLGKKWELTSVLNSLWLATQNDSVYANSGAVAVAANPEATSRFLGIELDIAATYKQNRHVTYGFGFAHLFTGGFLNQSTPGKDFNYPFAYTTYIF